MEGPTIPVIWSKPNPLREWLLFLCTPIGIGEGLALLWDEFKEGN